MVVLWFSVAWVFCWSGVVDNTKLMCVADALNSPSDSDHHVEQARLLDCVKPYPLLKAALFPEIDEVPQDGE